MLKISVIVVVTLAIVDVNFASIFSWNSDIPIISEEMKLIYKSKILPLEEYYYYDQFHYPKLEDGHFDAKPTLVFVGQYSTGTVFNFHHFYILTFRRF
jgi:hypothetical protein